jgi:hypothetical protein
MDGLPMRLTTRTASGSWASRDSHNATATAGLAGEKKRVVELNQMQQPVNQLPLRRQFQQFIWSRPDSITAINCSSVTSATTWPVRSDRQHQPQFAFQHLLVTAHMANEGGKSPYRTAPLTGKSAPAAVADSRHLLRRHVATGQGRLGRQHGSRRHGFTVQPVAITLLRLDGMAEGMSQVQQARTPCSVSS